MGRHYYLSARSICKKSQTSPDAGRRTYKTWGTFGSLYLPSVGFQVHPICVPNLGASTRLCGKGWTRNTFVVRCLREDIGLRRDELWLAKGIGREARNVPYSVLHADEYDDDRRIYTLDRLLSLRIFALGERD